VRALGVAGFAIVTAVSASCASLSGIDDYSLCSDNCLGTSKGPATVHDDGSTSTEPPGVDAATGDDAPTEPPEDASEMRAVEASSPLDTGLADSMPSLVDAQVADVAPPPEAGPDAVAPVDAGVGPSCGPLASRIRCAGNQVCCANVSAQTNACSAPGSCGSNATLTCSTASDCPSSAPICCGQLALVADAMGDLPPKCTATTLAASCAASCNDLPPSDATNCKYPSSGTGTIRLCSHDTDCSSDLATVGGGCYNFNGAPVSWCATFAAGGEGKRQM
jgi:hypothetical protein